jgi:hypothetical protein
MIILPGNLNIFTFTASLRSGLLQCAPLTQTQPKLKHIKG